MHELTTYYNRGGELQTIKGRIFDAQAGDEQLIPKRAIGLIAEANFNGANICQDITRRRIRLIDFEKWCYTEDVYSELIRRNTQAVLARWIIDGKFLRSKLRLQLENRVSSLRAWFSRKAVIKDGSKIRTKSETGRTTR